MYLHTGCPPFYEALPNCPDFHSRSDSHIGISPSIGLVLRRLRPPNPQRAGAEQIEPRIDGPLRQATCMIRLLSPRSKDFWYSPAVRQLDRGAICIFSR